MSSLSSWGRTALCPVLEARAREEAMQHSASPAASLTGQRFGHLPGEMLPGAQDQRELPF